MANTLTKQFVTVMGDKIVGCYKCVGDGSDTGATMPVAIIDGAWAQVGTTTAASSSATVVSWGETSTGNSGVVNFQSAPLSDSVTYVFFVGH